MANHAGCVRCRKGLSVDACVGSPFLLCRHLISPLEENVMLLGYLPRRASHAVTKGPCAEDMV